MLALAQVTMIFLNSNLWCIQPTKWNLLSSYKETYRQTNVVHSTRLSNGWNNYVWPSLTASYVILNCHTDNYFIICWVFDILLVHNNCPHLLSLSLLYRGMNTFQLDLYKMLSRKFFSNRTNRSIILVQPTQIIWSIWLNAHVKQIALVHLHIK